MHYQNPKGSAFIELIIAIPILLILALWTIEYGLILETKQKVATLNREVAHSVFRRCAFNARDEEIRCCASQIVKEIFSTSEYVLTLGGSSTNSSGQIISKSNSSNKPGFTILLSVYRKDTPSDPIRRVAAIALPPDYGATSEGECFNISSGNLAASTGISSDFDTAHPSVASLLETNVTGRDVLVISEMSYPFISFSGEASRKVGLDFMTLKDVAFF